MRYKLLILLLVQAAGLAAQVSRLGRDISYSASLQATAGKGDAAPFWFTNNRYGLSTLEPNSGLLRAAIQREAETDSLRHWRVGYGLDVAAAVNFDSRFVLQQLYADFQFKAIRLSLGQKERPLELHDNRLSSGAMTNSINARPLPQIRLELPDFWTIPRTGGWLALKGHIAYGTYTDNKWQREFTGGNSLHTANSLFHSKAGFLRIGNEEKFPLSLTGGIEMDAQFGGEAWHLQDRENHTGPFESHQKLQHGLKAFWHALIPGGSDVNDGDFSNVEGNHLGSWHLRMDFARGGWRIGAYAEHFFEDHSQMFWQYPWKDMLYGLELRLPCNPFLKTLVYEHLRTTDQSGPIYHDATDIIPTQVSAIDNYYNHHIYSAWQHAGFSMGHALLLSPLYNSNGSITFYDNRVRAHHIGLEGQPSGEFAYRILYTHERSWGTYPVPRTDPVRGNYLLLEASYAPRQVKGLTLTVSYGQNAGRLTPDSKGGMLTVSYTGWINRTTKR